MSQSDSSQYTRPVADLEAEIRGLKRRLAELDEALRAIQSGAVDGFVLDGGRGRKVYTLETADRPYRLMFEHMEQAAATLLIDGTIAYCNPALASLLDVPRDRLVGSVFWNYIAFDDTQDYRKLGEQGEIPSVQREARLRRADGETVSVYLALNGLPHDCPAAMGVVVTDLMRERHHQQQERELRDIKLLQEISGQLLQARDPGALYRQILDAAVTLMQADKGTPCRPASA